MGRLRQDLELIDRLTKPDGENILFRCEEILQATYGTPLKPGKQFRYGLRQRREIARIIRRLRLSAHWGGIFALARGRRSMLHRFAPALLSNLVRHARMCCTPARPKCHICPLVSFCSSGIMRSSSRRGARPVAIDLFAGAGGLSAGFRREGFHVALAVEMDRNAAQSYRVNNPGVPVIEGDVRKIRVPRILRALGLHPGRITAVIAGPPCQGFSAAGPREPRAERNLLFRSVARIAKGVRASVLVMENVPGLKRVGGVSFERKILEYFRGCGYIGSFTEVDASKFGVPQRRRRLIFICARRASDISSFRLRPLESVGRPSVRRALGGLPSPYKMPRQSRRRIRHKAIYNHRVMTHSARVIRKIRRIRPGEGPISYRRLRLDLAHTIIAGHRAMPVHPRQHRTITVREAARLQTMPDTFRFLGPHSEQPLQAANVVPYRLSRAIARSLLTSINPPRSHRH
jgi:DNA (cytosine-5)-methyltransferase 1